MNKRNLSFALLMSLFSVASLSSRADTLPKPTLSANCRGIWGTSFSDGGYENFSATTTDDGFNKAESVVTLNGSIESHRAFGILELPVYNASEKINMGGGYSVNLEIKVLKDMLAGDFLFDMPELRIAAELLYNGVPVNSAVVMSQHVVDSSNWGATSNGHYLTVSAALQNLPLKQYLKVPNYLNSDLAQTVAQSKNRAEIYEKFGDSKKVLTSAGVECEVQLPWTPTGDRIP